jgi:excisionase family DNA binding protein
MKNEKRADAADGFGVPSLDVMTVAETARYIRSSAQTVYDYARKGIIPSVKYGTRIVFLKGDLNDWLFSLRQGKNAVAVPAQAAVEDA